MAFGWAGAASGANAAVTQQRDELQKYLAQQFAQKLQQEQLALQQQSGQRAQQQLDATLESNAAAGQRAGRDQQLQEAGLRFGMLKDQPQGTQLAPADVAAFKGTPYEAGIDQKQTLPSRRVVDLQPVGQSQPTVTDPQADAGGQDYATMRPTQAQMQATGQQSARRTLVDLVKRGAPRTDVIGAMADAGENITPAMLEDPAQTRADARRQAVDMENLRNRHELGQIGAKAEAEKDKGPALMQVTETDPATGETITKLVPKQAGEVGRRPAPTPTQGQFSAGGYAGRIEQAEGVLSKLEGNIAGMHTASYAVQDHMPPAGESDDFQSYSQASRNFINAVLRRESGAAISPSEFDSAQKQYLPRPGDAPQTLQQKKANRQYVFETMKREAGRAYQAPVAPPAAGAQPGGNIKSITEIP